MTDAIFRRPALASLLAWTMALIGGGCGEEQKPPAVASLARPDDVAFVCMLQQDDGTRQFFVHRQECRSCRCDELLAFVTQSARDEVGIVRIESENSSAKGPVDTDRRIPLYTGVPVGPEGHLPGAIVALEQLGHVVVANRGSPYLTAIPFTAAHSTAPAVEQIELAAPVGALVRSSRTDLIRLYAALPSTGQIAVVDFTDSWPTEPVAVRYLDLASPWSQDCLPLAGPTGDAGPAPADGGVDDGGHGDSGFPSDGAAADGAPSDGDLSDGAADAADGGLGDGASWPDEVPQIADLVTRAVGDEEELLYVALSDVPCIAVVQPDSGDLHGLVSERSTKRLALVPEAAGRVRGGATLPDRGGPWLYALDAERSGVLVFDLSTEATEDLSEGNPMLAYPGLVIPGVARDVTIVENYPEICDNGRDDDDDGTSDEPACQKAGTTWSESVPWGVFALISSANGKLYVVAVQDEWEDATGNLAAHCVVRDGDSRSYEATIPGCRRHQWFSETNPTTELPRLAEPPQLVTADTERTLQFGTTDQGPRFGRDSTSEEAGTKRFVPVLDAGQASTGSDESTRSYETHGIFFDWVHPTWSLNETWTMTYQGVLPGSQRTSGNVGEADEQAQHGYFEDERGVSFCALGVLAGDRLVITSGPSDGAPDTCLVTYSDDGVFAPLSYQIDEVRDSSLSISVISGGPEAGVHNGTRVPTEACFGEAVTYEIRTRQWLLRGEATGFLRQRRVDESSDRCVDLVPDCPAVTCSTELYQNPEDEQLLRRNDPPDSRCLLNGRVTAGQAFANPFFCFHFVDGTSARDDQVTWTVTGGLRRRVIDAGSLPTRLRYNSWDQQLYVIDPSELGLIQVSLNGLTQTTNYR